MSSPNTGAQEAPFRRSTSSDNARRPPDRLLLDLADYALDYTVRSEATCADARLCVTDSLACALDALDVPECTRLLGPVVAGTVVPHGARVPGTGYVLDPVLAAFDFGAMIRWFDLNDAFTAAKQGSHPSDNLAGILMLGDHLSRQRGATGGEPLRMREVLRRLVQAYEIQGCLGLRNDFYEEGIDHNLLTQVASAAVLCAMLGATRDQVVNAISNAWINCSLATYRYAPNTGSRKSWACADAVAHAMRLALMAVKGETGSPSVLTAAHFGFHDARFGGRPVELPQPLGEYVLPRSMFKLVPAGMHSQSAMECAFSLHAQVKDRLDEIERIELHCHRALIDIMHKTGPLHNPGDRDHCLQYVVAVGLIHGAFTPRSLEDDFAADPRIDRLRGKMVVTEEPRYTRDYYEPSRGASGNAVRVHFMDGTSTGLLEVEYPIGHPRRRADAGPALRSKFAASLGRRFPDTRRDRILTLCDDPAAFDAMAVDDFVALFAIPDSTSL